MMKTKTVELPTEVRETDLKYPSWSSSKPNEDNRVVNTFEMWYTERFGWCIPTLFISRARRGSNMNDRTYGVSVRDGGVVTMGKGPHVLRTVTVYVKKSRVEALKKFTDLKTKGEGDAGQIRDRISTRRANTMLRRNSYAGGFWNS